MAFLFLFDTLFLLRGYCPGRRRHPFYQHVHTFSWPFPLYVFNVFSCAFWFFPCLCYRLSLSLFFLHRAGVYESRDGRFLAGHRHSTSTPRSFWGRGSILLVPLYEPAFSYFGLFCFVSWDASPFITALFSCCLKPLASFLITFFLLYVGGKKSRIDAWRRLNCGCWYCLYIVANVVCLDFNPTCAR